MLNKLLHIICIISTFIVCIGAINYLFIAHDRNFLEKITGEYGSKNKIIYTIIGICGIFVILCKITWLVTMKQL
jgi:uncharacterized membrane protein YuzA (DUF378 family)